MKFKIVPNIIFIIIAVIVGGALLKQIDVKPFSVENPALAIIYLIVFIASILFMIKKSK